MDSREREDLHAALDREKVVRVHVRLMLVHLVLDEGMTRKMAARILRKRGRWVSKWLARYAEGGLAALRDLPRSGRPPAVPRRRLAWIMERISRAPMTPEMARSAIAD